MAEGYKDWVAGEFPTAANIEDYLQLQTIMRFADASARNTALSSVLTEGLHAFLKDTNTLTVYTGSAWSTIGPVHGALSTWAPVITQSGTVTHTVTEAKYMRIGRMVIGNFYLAVTGSGSASNVVTVTAPVTAAVASNKVIGAGNILDTSAPADYNGALRLNTTTTMVISSSSSTNFLGVDTFTAGLANLDAVSGAFSYEAAADA